MISKNDPPSAELPTVLDWREVARTSCAKIDWARVAQTALGSALLAGLVGGAMHVIGRVIESEEQPGAESPDAAAVSAVPDKSSPCGDHDDNGKGTGDWSPFDGAFETPAADDGSDADDAAKLLGIDLTASEDAIRAALRSHLASSGIHPDQGGDGEQARQFIAAKNLLIERARARRP